MDRIRRRIVYNGLLWGIVSFGLSWLAVFITVPPNPLGLDARNWQQVSWLLLNLNLVPVSGSTVSSSLFANFFTTDFLETHPHLRLLRIIPLLSAIIGSILLSESMGFTTRPIHLIKNGAALSGGYVAGGLATIVISDARPEFTMVIAVFGIVGLSLYIGSTIADKFVRGIPVIALTSLGGIFLIGIVFLAGFTYIIQVLLPLVTFALIGGETGSILIYFAREYGY